MPARHATAPLPHAAAAAPESVERLLAMARDLGLALVPSPRVLDFGCGYGDVVRELRTRGFDAEGVDVLPFWAEAKDRYWEEREPVPEALRAHLHVTTLNPYRMPFADSSFDLIISSQVFEHVMDYHAVFRELRRVLKPNGLGINIFPSRWSPVEMHVFVPLATVLRGRSWLALWALLGIRNRFQRGLSWREVLEKNHDYLINQTNYPTNKVICRWATEAGVEVRFAPILTLTYGEGRAGRIARKFPFPGASWLYATIYQRTMILRRA
jgi:SAM-dependent methyltransferase